LALTRSFLRKRESSRRCNGADPDKMEVKLETNSVFTGDGWTPAFAGVSGTG
jgi:hypothetical protein